MSINLIILLLVASTHSLLFAAEKIRELSLTQQKVEFRPSRSDLTVGGAYFSVMCIRKATETEKKKTGNTFVQCDTFRMNGVEQSDWLNQHPIPATALNEVTLPSQKIEYSTAMGGYVCIAIHEWFNEIPNKVNVQYYAIEKDRYSVLSYCTVETIPDWGWDNARVTHNRVGTLDKFTETLSQTINIRNTDRPLPVRFDTKPFWGRDLNNGELYQCGQQMPMPDGRVPDVAEDPILIPVGVYEKWEFIPDKRYQCHP